MSKVDLNCTIWDVLGLWLSYLNALACWQWQGVQHNRTASAEQSTGLQRTEVHTTYITGALFRINCRLGLWAVHPLVAETHLLRALFPC